VEHLPVVVRRGHLPARSLQTQPEEPLAALVEAPAHQVLAVEEQQVEGDQRHGVDPRQRGGPGGVADVHAVGHRGEPRDAVGERDDLPVEQHVVAEAGEALQLGVGDAHLVLVAGPDLHGPAADLHQHPDAVPLDLVHPLLAARHGGPLGGEHRSHAAILS
jgi:hypothetical protein